MADCQVNCHYQVEKMLKINSMDHKWSLLQSPDATSVPPVVQPAPLSGWGSLSPWLLAWRHCSGLQLTGAKTSGSHTSVNERLGVGDIALAGSWHLVSRCDGWHPASIAPPPLCGVKSWDSTWDVFNTLVANFTVPGLRACPPLYVLVSKSTPIPIKRIDVKKKKLMDANSSLLQSITGVPPIDISVNCLRKFCVCMYIPGLGSSAGKLKCM